MARVVVTDHAFVDVEQERAVAAELGADFEVRQCTTEAETLAAVAGADVAVVNFAPMTADVLAAMAPGAAVVRYGVGYDNVDVEAAKRLGVAVANVPDYGSDTVADHTVAALLALLRRIPDYDRRIRTDGWCQPASVGPVAGFASTTVGLIGTGRIGLAVARRLTAFGITVLAHDPYARDLGPDGPELVALEDLFARSHAVSLHCPLLPETKHLLDRDAFAKMRPGAVVVNTSRGGLIDPQALVEAIEAGTVVGAALDVFEVEPLEATSPLRDRPEILFSPHAAFYSDDSLAALQRLAADEVRRALTGVELRSRVA